jgi:hypothetical protein
MMKAFPPLFMPIPAMLAQLLTPGGRRQVSVQGPPSVTWLW